MDVVIFCGGRGTRLSEKTDVIPKPLVNVGDWPILWHIMKIYSVFNHERFILTLGYKGEMIKQYFLNFPWLCNSFEIDLKKPITPSCSENWSILFKDTGLNSTTGKRLNAIKGDINGDRFMLTYGDGVGDININELIEFHDKMKKKHGTIGTITTFNPRSKYGVFCEENGMAKSFEEKPISNELINIGFMVLEKEIFDYIEDDKMFEETIPKLVASNKLAIYRHNSFWGQMDTYRDYMELNALWDDSKPWKVWK